MRVDWTNGFAALRLELGTRAHSRQFARPPISDSDTGFSQGLLPWECKPWETRLGHLRGGLQQPRGHEGLFSGRS